MRRMIALGLLYLSLAIAAPSGHGQEIGWVTLTDKQDERTVAGTVEHAYTRSGNRFLAGLTPGQLAELSAQGIEIEVLLSGADPATTYIISPACHLPEQTGHVHIDLDQLGRRIDLGAGRSLMPLSPLAAGEVNATHGYHATPLKVFRVRWHYLPPVWINSLAQIDDFPGDSLVTRVSVDSLLSWTTRLEAFQTRYIWTDSIHAARDWIMQKFADWGYTDISMQPFSWGGGTHYNVVVVKPGYAEPDKVIVVGGHYDSITYGQSPGAEFYAPGADDNGSGTATTMEVARVLADIPLRKTIIFIPFSAEEVGLVGSQYAAEQFVLDSTELEVMYNFDMVAYDPDSSAFISVSGDARNLAYMELTADAAYRVTNLVPVPSSSPGGSDHQSFRDQGYPIVNTIEANFNYPGWHTNLDLSSRLNFLYHAEVTKMALASIATVADAAHPTPIERIVDVGDGQSLEVLWGDCEPSYQYRVYWGETAGQYTDSAVAAPGSCSYVVTGLSDGVTYYLSVVGETPDGHPAIYAEEAEGVPYIVPRSPQQVIAQAELNRVSIDWADNGESDLAYYRVYRKTFGYVQELLADQVVVSAYDDQDVMSQVEYSYQITAVDFDGYESELSNVSSAFAATFDGGIAIVDEISQAPSVPTQEEQEAFFAAAFAGAPYSIEQVDEESSVLSRSTAGQYSSLFYFDDDLSGKRIGNSEDSLDWYVGYSGNVLIGGLRTIQFWGSSTLEPGDIRYDDFGLADYTDNPAFDFAGAHGQDGWPTVEVDLDNIFGLLPYIPTLEPRPGATVIYTYDADSDNPLLEGGPVGLMYESNGGIRVLLSFPVSFLTEATAAQLVARAREMFGETAVAVTDGDVDDNGVVNLADMVYLVAVLYSGGPPLPAPNQADVDGGCDINVGDLTYLVAYLYAGGPAPLPGCVE